MGDLVLDINAIDVIIKKAVGAIDDAKTELYDIVENLRTELKSLKDEYVLLDKEIKELTSRIDQLKLGLGKAKFQLLSVSKNYKSYSENQIKEAYEKADEIRIDLSVAEEKEKITFLRRSQTELKIKNITQMLKKADQMLNQVGVVMNYLSGDLQDISLQLEDIKSRQVFALKILKAQESERFRIARDMHDGPAQTMANIVLKAELCEKLLNINMDKAKDELVNLKGLVRGSLAEVRKIIYDLRPMAIDDLGIVPTIERYATSFGYENGFFVEFVEKGKLTKENTTVSLSIFRIVQEALNNIKKHAKAKNVKIIFMSEEEHISLKIEDDGVGFDINQLDDSEAGNNDRFGLSGMQERVKLLEGKFFISSQVNVGTKIVITIPIK